MTRRWRVWAIICGALCLLAAWPWLANRQRIAEQERILQSRAFPSGKLRLAQRELKPIFENADKVDSFRLASRFDSMLLAQEGRSSSGKLPRGRVGGFYYMTPGKTGGAKFAARLGEAVLDPRSYAPETLCKFDPTVAFRVVQGTQAALVVICFGCSQLMVIEPTRDVPLKSLGGLEGRFRIGGVFDVFRPELVALAQEAFPNDKKIQSLARD